MLSLIRAEYYKLWKNKGIFAILALALIPLLFGIFVSLDLKGLKISKGAFDLIAFPNNMWQFTIGTSLPIIVLSYLSASLGRELKNGSLVYQVTRVAERSKIIYSKILTILSLNVFYFLLFQLIGMVSYLLFINGTPFASPTVWDAETIQQLFVSLFALLLQMSFCLLSMLLSLKISTIGLVCFTFVATNLLSFLANMEKIAVFVLGSVFYAPQKIAEISFNQIMLLQASVIILLTALVGLAVKYQFKKIAV